MSDSQMTFDLTAPAQDIFVEVVEKNLPVEKISEEAQPEQKIYSVSSLNAAIREQLEGEFPLIWLQGEISNFKPHSSGHYYFSLKDEKAQINAVMFKGFNSHLKFKPESGLEVIVRGRVTVYAPRGQYQIFCEVMEPVGLGALQLQFEQLKKKLQAEGLFELSRKRAIPTLPQRVAIVTSPTGAAIRDMVNVLNRRYKALEVFIFPASVQGNAAPREIIAAIELAQAVSEKVGGFDVMIVGRGGGSIEDLWAFNDENVARAIANSKIPVVSGVGHEIDFTIADFVADLRAPTPSAAAELIVKNAADVSDKIKQAQIFLRNFIIKKLQLENQKLSSLRKLLVDPKRKLQELTQRCDELLARLEKAIKTQLEFDKNKISSLAALLDSLSPLRVLDRGYAVVKDTKDKIVKSVKNLKQNQILKVQLQDGSFEAKVSHIEGAKDV